MGRVRAATRADAPSIAQVNIAAWRTAFRGVFPDSFLKTYTDPGATRRFDDETAEQYVYVTDEQVVGWLWLMPCTDDDLHDCLEVKGCYVHPARWRTGVGRTLMNQARRRAARLGALEVSLWTPADTLRSRRFYEALSYSHDGSTGHLDLGEPVSLVRYRRQVR